jgi:hypothetical protein
MTTKRERQAAEYAADQGDSVSDEANKRWRTYVTEHVGADGVGTYTMVGTVETHGGQDYVRVGDSLQTPRGWHASEADAIRDAAGRVAEIHGAISQQLSRLLRGER